MAAILNFAWSWCRINGSFVLLHALIVAFPVELCWGPGAVVKAACLGSRRFQTRTPLWHSSYKETKCFFPAHFWRFNLLGSLRDREGASSASDHQVSNFESCVRREVSSHSSHHPQEVILAQFSLKHHSFVPGAVLYAGFTTHVCRPPRACMYTCTLN